MRVAVRRVGRRRVHHDRDVVLEAVVIDPVQRPIDARTQGVAVLPDVAEEVHADLVVAGCLKPHRRVELDADEALVVDGIEDRSRRVGLVLHETDGVERNVAVYQQARVLPSRQLAHELNLLGDRTSV